MKWPASVGLSCLFTAGSVLGGVKCCIPLVWVGSTESFLDTRRYSTALWRSEAGGLVLVSSGKGGRHCHTLCSAQCDSALLNHCTCGC